MALLALLAEWSMKTKQTDGRTVAARQARARAIVTTGHPLLVCGGCGEGVHGRPHHLVGYVVATRTLRTAWGAPTDVEGWAEMWQCDECGAERQWGWLNHPPRGYLAGLDTKEPSTTEEATT